MTTFFLLLVTAFFADTEGLAASTAVLVAVVRQRIAEGLSFGLGLGQQRRAAGFRAL